METFVWVFYKSEKSTSKIWLEFVLVFFTFISFFSKASFQEHNVLSDCVFWPFTYMCCENCIMSFFSIFLFLTHFVYIIAKWKLLAQLSTFVISRR